MRRIIALFVMTALVSGCVGSPQPPPRRQGGHQAGRASPYRTMSASKCLADLGSRAASFTPVPDEYYGAGCSTINTVKLVGLMGDDGQFTLTNLGPVSCPLADTLAGWARFGVDRAARQILGSPLARIETMGSYNCRNVAGTEHRSGHATANAIDVSAFVLADGRRISVLGSWHAGGPQERAFLRTVHESACKRFGTVLGPDYNEAHRNHFHLEMSVSAFCR